MRLIQKKKKEEKRRNETYLIVHPYPDPALHRLSSVVEKKLKVFLLLTLARSGDLKKN